MPDIVFAGVSMSAVIMAIIQWLKNFKWFNNQYSPFAAIALGLLAAIGYHFETGQYTIAQMIITGIAVGFQATGLYEAGSYFNPSSTVVQPQPYTPYPNQPVQPIAPVVEPVTPNVNPYYNPYNQNPVAPTPTPTPVAPINDYSGGNV